MTKIAGSGSAFFHPHPESGSISQRHGSADLDPDPAPQQNVRDPQQTFYSVQTTSVVDPEPEIFITARL
jgi:hypothetical protein